MKQVARLVDRESKIEMNFYIKLLHNILLEKIQKKFLHKDDIFLFVNFSYGFSFPTESGKRKELAEKINGFLNEKKIEFKTDHHRFYYRFKIERSEANEKILLNL